MFAGLISDCVEVIVKGLKVDPDFSSFFTDDSKTELTKFGGLCLTFATIYATLKSFDMIAEIFAQEWIRLSDKDKNA